MTRSDSKLSLATLGRRGESGGVGLLGVGVDLLSVDVDMHEPLLRYFVCDCAGPRALNSSPQPAIMPTDDSSPPRTRGVVHNVCDSFRSRAYTCTTGVELNRIERHSSQTANKGLRHNVLRCYRIEANRATYEYRCTAREFAAVPAIP